ncbi:adenylosuccinate lyase [Candidatus Mycoplasma haematolamae str. Purdue]|uniref:Adenylosuccinate lyase n=1 Tax=Mycoplasma haematolamae (strain Purdue) TaxID=1212765 RepID=I7BK70_MYCHA|nr:adenylosuccinate lyase [Candidatus Mycoplasma haematolamae]AFO52273.1 adenylosuccinate lyase [Candidatus Mycoplasma haematolamae str. Purdue]
MIKRYQIPQLEHFFSDSSKYKRWTLLEKEVLYSLSSFLQIPEAEVIQLERKIPELNPYEVTAAESKTKHDFVAFLRVLEEKIQEVTASKFLHYGLTSSDIIDSAVSLTLREVNDLLIEEIEELQSTLYHLAYRYIDTVQVGRTHGQHAEPTSFGYKFAITYQEIESALESLYQDRRNLEVITIKGSVGTYAHIGPDVQEDLAYRLHMFSGGASYQALPRNRYTAYLNSLSLIGQIINSLAFTLRTLAREEIAEVCECFEEEQVGSSSMPHKLNPVTLENISGLTRWLSSLASLSQDNIPLWEERDISHSSNERMSLMDAPILLYNIVHKMTQTLKRMKVNEEQLKQNLSLTKGLITSQSVMLALLKSPKIKSREEAHTLISQLSQRVRNKESASLLETLSSPHIKELLADEEIEVASDLQRHLKHLPRLYQQIFKNEIESSYYHRRLLNKYEIKNAIHYLAQRLNWYYTDPNNLWDPEDLSREKLVDSKYNQEAVLVLSLLEGASNFAGNLLPLLNFPVVFVSLHCSGFSKSKWKFEASKYQEQTAEDIPLETGKESEQDDDYSLGDNLESSRSFQKLLKLSKKYSRVLILEDIVDSKTTLKALYKTLGEIPTIKEIKCASLFVKVVDHDIDPIYKEEYYRTTLFSPDYSGSVEAKKTRDFNFKNWSEGMNIKFFNWYGLLISEDVWVVGFGLDNDQKYRNFQSLGVFNPKYS